MNGSNDAAMVLMCIFISMGIWLVDAMIIYGIFSVFGVVELDGKVSYPLVFSALILSMVPAFQSYLYMLYMTKKFKKS